MNLIGPALIFLVGTALLGVVLWRRRGHSRKAILDAAAPWGAAGPIMVALAMTAEAALVEHRLLDVGSLLFALASAPIFAGFYLGIGLPPTGSPSPTPRSPPAG